MEAVQNRLSLCPVVVPQLAQNQKEEGCVSRLLGELPNHIFISTGDGSVSGILYLALKSAGVRGLLIQGNCDEGQLLWQADATAGSSASLPGLMDVCAGGIGAG